MVSSKTELTQPGDYMEVSGWLSVLQVQERLKFIRAIQKEVMIKEMHYGVIPGTNQKPTLLQPGAQMLAMIFKLSCTYKVEIDNFPDNHREVRVITTVRPIGAEAILGEGYGSASTLEKKYAYRNAPEEYINTGHAVPGSFWKLKDAELKNKTLRQIARLNPTDKQRVGTKKINDIWHVVILASNGEQKKVANPEIPDTWNTVLKIAIKRSLVAAVLTVTAASDVFTQDLEDGAEPHSWNKEGEREPEPNQEEREPHSAKGQEGRQQATERSKATNPPATEETPTTGQPEAATGAGEEGIEGSWKNVKVHFKCSFVGKRLGQLNEVQLKTMRDMWLPKVKAEWQSTNIEDRRLAVALDIGLIERKLNIVNGPGQEQAQEQAQDETHTTKSKTSEQTETSELGEAEEKERIEAIAKIESNCASFDITPTILLQKLGDDERFPAAPPGMFDLSDERLSTSLLQNLADLEQFAELQALWGYRKPEEPKVNPVPAEPQKATRQPRKATKAKKQPAKKK